MSNDPLNPSAEWTSSERAALVQELLRQTGRLLPKGSSSLGLPKSTVFKVQDLNERIRFVQHMSADFLEANRQDILHGNKLPSQ